MSTRPFLSQEEKGWITYQLLMALSQAHGAGASDGSTTLADTSDASAGSLAAARIPRRRRAGQTVRSPRSLPFSLSLSLSLSRFRLCYRPPLCSIGGACLPSGGFDAPHATTAATLTSLQHTALPQKVVHGEVKSENTSSNNSSSNKLQQVVHGDVKSENIMVTSWGWVVLTDFASFKPTYLPADEPAPFHYFFATSGRRCCYLAPERFRSRSVSPRARQRRRRTTHALTSAAPLNARRHIIAPHMRSLHTRRGSCCARPPGAAR